ncbi:MAG: copper chaperone PCu(A)C [Proteobacteria bacterium]|nr:copper chaperone PCu(A)C [Pseudomonadota bacterium]
MIRFVSALAASIALASGNVAMSAPVATVRVEHAWIRWLPANLPAAGYATIRNDGDQSLALDGADSPDYGMAMLHRSVRKDGNDRMEMVDAIAIPAHASVQLAPGGYHLMLTEPKRPIKPGDTVHVRLHFSDGTALDAAWVVRPANAS